MAEEKAPLMFSEEWVKEIFDNKKSVAKIPRVATPLLDGKPEAYIPHSFSLGPYWNLEKRIAASSSSAADCYEYHNLKMAIRVDAYKVQSAATFWENCGKSLDEIVEKMKGMQQRIADFYDCPIGTDGENFARMMAIDSSFLLRFLCSEFGSSNEDMRYLSMRELRIKCDILKLENQIPLFVLREVLNVLREVSNDVSHLTLYPRFQDFWRSKYNMQLSPFNQFHITDPKVYIPFHMMFIELLQVTYCLPTNNESDQPHLLALLHAFVSPFLHMEVINGQGATPFQIMKYSLEVVVAEVFTFFCVRHPSRDGRHNIVNSYSARELKKRGIKFKSFSTMCDHIRFDKYSGTFYLPRITVPEMQTEVFLRNMVAFEFNEAARGSDARGDSVTRYVGLMDCLIDTPEDVRLLRESHVFHAANVMTSDEKIAGMWNGMCHPILTGHLEPPEDLHNALNEVLARKYYMSMVKKGVALFVGILFVGILLAVTFAQISRLK